MTKLNPGEQINGDRSSSQFNNDNSQFPGLRSLSSLCWANSQEMLESAAFSQHDLVCLSHLRWDFVYQRPQHLLTRCAKSRRVFFIEEPIYTEQHHWWLEISKRESGVWIVVPHLPSGLNEEMTISIQRSLIDDLFAECHIRDYILWYYTAMALPFSAHLQPAIVLYDCMDELSAFKGAPPILRQREAELLKRADLVFTGGQSLYEAKRDHHPHVHAFPSSIEVEHFAQARQINNDPVDQADIPHPRLGFFGVIDERMDIQLLDEVAQARPDWHLVVIGPVVKIDPATLPNRPNIHYLGGKSYQELPHYVSGWDAALLPFARNESTRFISPTKTPEYLAAGKPVVSTSIRDVVRPYGEQQLVQIADTADSFVTAIEVAMQQADAAWLDRVDLFLSQNSWDLTWAKMNDLIEMTIARKQKASQPPVSSVSKPKSPKSAQSTGTQRSISMAQGKSTVQAERS
ncbi:MAG TPA: glycosyltransferase family 1 protein [Trichocoleus sp.]|jgi:UDP-galactopyranose mutase